MADPIDRDCCSPSIPIEINGDVAAVTGRLVLARVEDNMLVIVDIVDMQAQMIDAVFTDTVALAGILSVNQKGLMSDERSNWQEVLRQVLERDDVTSPSGDHQISLTQAQALPTWSSPTQLLTALRASAAGGSEKKILNVLHSDRERRMSIARKSANKPKKIVMVTLIILLTVTVGVLFLPNSPTDFDDYFIDIGVPSAITGLLGVASLVASLAIEMRSPPRSLPYSPPLLIVYGVLFALGTVMFSMHVSNYGYWFLPGATVGAVCIALTAVGYLALFFWVQKRQTMIQALHGDTSEGRELDAALNEHTSKILRKRDDLDEDHLRRRTAEGVRLLHESGRVSTEAAVSMMREIATPLN